MNFINSVLFRLKHSLICKGLRRLSVPAFRGTLVSETLPDL